MLTDINVNQARVFWVCFFLWLGLPPASMAERLYHWTDETGQIHITQEPPPRKGQLQEIMDYAQPSKQNAPGESERPANRRDPEREQDIMLEIEKRRYEGTESAIRESRQERPAESPGPNSCYVELPAQDMYVRVFDIDESGSRGVKIWSGPMKKFERRLFNSRRGKVSIDFKVGPRDPYHTHDVRICDNGGTIRLLPR